MSIPEPQKQISESSSPHWNGTTKLIISLVLLLIVVGLVTRFRAFISPLLIAVIIAYLIHPLADLISKGLHAPWRLSVTLLYLIIIILFLGAITLGGIALVEQVQNLIVFIQKQVANLPKLIDDLSHQAILIGPFTFDLSQLDTASIGQQVLGWVEPILTKLGGLVGAIATGAVSTVGWVLFALLVSYFVVADSGGMKNGMIHLEIPGYHEDTRIMGRELNRIWKAFLRNQMIIFLLTVAIYNILLGALGVNYSFGLALVAGLARFVPYVGPFVAWVTYGTVSFLQGTTIFGLQPFAYALLVVGVAWLTDIIMDNFVVPRMTGDALNIHPAAVMIFALIAANLFGIVGLLLAAPVLATFMLILNYAIRKLFDMDPWEGLRTRSRAPNLPIQPFLRKIDRFFRRFKKNSA
ncbi:predicted permease [Longilinea arvoryzae]|uniref:Predicted permease n=1 Tax=Longilinea arvoryzae TaxID=360412 RepID=A0A0S7BLH8_9CHLR|nr:AI-2E family transporter [Longilinea arvoryzae]GAP15176.1 predicted permease [Longilinea arvoryzae]